MLRPPVFASSDEVPRSFLQSFEALIPISRFVLTTPVISSHLTSQRVLCEYQDRVPLILKIKLRVTISFDLVIFLKSKLKLSWAEANELYYSDSFFILLKVT